jgi:pimeloyl-ACP methyl ester carboxylesterase
MRPNAIAVVALFVVGTAAWAEQPARLRFEPYVIQGFDGVERHTELGRFNAPARHAQPAGDTIELAVVRFKSTAMSPGDPIVFLMGGPGIPASVMAQVSVYAQLFDRLGAVADVILLDQRGTGLSSPALDCPVREASLGPGAFERHSALLAEMLTEIRPCVASWRARGVDPAAYTSDENAADVAGSADRPWSESSQSAGVQLRHGGGAHGDTPA